MKTTLHLIIAAFGLAAFNLSRGDDLTTLSLPAGLTNLQSCDLAGNQLTTLSFPSDLTTLRNLDLDWNPLIDVSSLSGQTSLRGLSLRNTGLTNLILLSGLRNLKYLDLNGNPLTLLVLPEPVVGAVCPPIEDLRNQGVAVYVYPLETRLIAEHQSSVGTFRFTLAGPPGSYRVQITADFSSWADLDAVTNVNGSAEFTDSSAGLRARSFYRVKMER